MIDVPVSAVSKLMPCPEVALSRLRAPNLRASRALL